MDIFGNIIIIKIYFMTMTKKQVVEFLRQKKGYLKEGSNRLRSHFLKKGYNVSLKNCKEALQQVRKEFKTIQISKNKPIQKIKRLFFDIETSYNIGKFWKSGYGLNIQPEDIIHERAIITIAWKWEGDNFVNRMCWNNGDDKLLVEKFISLMNQADEIIGHNIERYDTSFILGRALKHGILALPRYKQYDTLKKAKSLFNLNSNKLDYIAKLVGLDGKYSHSGIKMWDNIILYDLFKIGSIDDRNNSMKEMLYYNSIDVMLTEAVFNRLRLYTTQEIHHGVLMGKPKFTCPNDGSENVEFVKTIVTASGTLQHIMKCNDCKQQFIISNREYLKFLKQ